MVSVIISSYNYEKYIKECIDSVLNQSYTDIEIIVVDDGSSDKTSHIIQAYDRFNIKYMYKENGGQLSCFNTAISHINGRFVFFLDADDMFKPDYIKKALDFYNENPWCDFLFCNRDFVNGHGERLDIQKKQRLYPIKKNYGYTTVIAFLNKLWIGSSTSCISMKADLLKKILPIPYEEDWKTRADDCLIWGASLMGGYKCFLNESLVQYRIHGNNYHYGKKISAIQNYKRMICINKLFKQFMSGYNVDQFEYLISDEFEALPEITNFDLKNYILAVLKSRIGSLLKIKCIIMILKRYIISYLK